MTEAMSEMRRLTGICYIRLQNGKTPQEIKTELLSSGFDASLVDQAMSEAHQKHTELATYRDREMMKGLGYALAFMIAGYLVSLYSADAPGRFRGLYIVIYLLGIGTAVLAIWSRAQRNH